MGLAESLCTV